MRYNIIFFIFILSSCGLKYTPFVSREELAQNRQKTVSQYIKDAYTDSNVVYQSVVFGPPTLIKPYQYRQLDSLYEIKYENELRRKFDKELEEKINNQKIIIENSKDKIKYVEHHIYSIQSEGKSTVYYADVEIDSQNEILDFAITQTYEFSPQLLSIFKSFVTRESIIYPNYAPTNEELDFYNFFEQELMNRLSYQQNDFMINTLETLLIARNNRSIDTKNILKNKAILFVEKRNYNANTDKFQNINGVWENDKLIKYEVEFSTSSDSYIGVFSPFFETISIVKN